MTDVDERWYGRHRWDSEPDHLEGIAGQLDAIADVISPRAGLDRTREYPEGVAGSSRRLALVMRRLAESARAGGRETWTAQDERPAGVEVIYHRDPHRTASEVDAFSLYVFGDFVLEDIAAAELQRRSQPPGGWKTFLDYLDDHETDPFTILARELNAIVRSTRNLLVTHPHRDYDLSIGWGGGEEIHIGRGTPWTDEGHRLHEEGAAITRELASELGLDARDLELEHPADLVEHTGRMNRDQRKKLYRALELTGPWSVSLRVVARLMKELVLRHAVASGVMDDPVQREAEVRREAADLLDEVKREG